MAEEKDIKYDIIKTPSGGFKTTLNRMYKSRKPWAPLNPKEIYSFMPGGVVELRVKKGDKVKKGDSLMLFRAIKMNNNILSPLDGKIKAIHVNEGDNIPKNTLMIELE